MQLGDHFQWCVINVNICVGLKTNNKLTTVISLLGKWNIMNVVSTHSLIQLATRSPSSYKHTYHFCLRNYYKRLRECFSYRLYINRKQDCGFVHYKNYRTSRLKVKIVHKWISKWFFCINKILFPRRISPKIFLLLQKSPRRLLKF